MDKFFSKLRIGEKIGLGFALVGLLFVGVVWHYHKTLATVLDDYQQLQVFEVRKSLALEIEIELAAVRDAEKGFLLGHQLLFAEALGKRLRALDEKVAALAAVDQDSRQTATALQALLTTYQERFQAVADAWRIMGLDENSGLQGAFRDKVHRLQTLAASYNVDRLYTLLLQIRRSEKDLALRQDPIYRERVRQLIAEFRQQLKVSELQDSVRQQLLTELAAYATSFEPYAETALKAGNVAGGRGPFRDAAHRIERLLNAYHVSNLEASVLQLRRREKDFLLRGDESYPPMVIKIAETIRAQISGSPISDADKTLLIGLLGDYQKDFLALVAQSSSIGVLTREMNAAAERVAPLVKANVDQANQMTASRVAEIADSSQESVRISLIVMFCAIALGVLLAVAMTRRIVRPVRQMAGLLDDLAYGSPTTRVPTVSNGRDEINAMAESLNALVEHRATFMRWWKESMDEVTARRELAAASNDEEKDEAMRDLRTATIAKLQQLNAIRSRLLDHGRHVLDVAQRLQAAPGGLTAEEGKSLEHAAKGMATLFEVLAREEAPARERAGQANASEAAATV
ncbi:methyl-accepting chemotaxis protein [Accumulibacter sp.]|uniref:methyl-accepting chemotaxis protein n=1 Tax=Accumulibacter sp. TaxID=2053492 RepID=UPI0028C4D7D7|nr:methyl-accepting chemotaxis protein [Accumulibacter sp.]